MKKFTSIVLSVMCLFLLCSCGKNAELEALKKENADLKNQLQFNDASTPESKNNKEKRDQDIILVKQELVEPSYKDSEYTTANFTIKNNTSGDINTITLNINILDENGDIISTTHPQESSVVSPNQSITLEALAEKGAYAFQVYGYSYYEGSDLDEYKQGRFEKDIDKLFLNN